MKLLIDISKNDYEEIKEYGINTFSSLAIAIQNGTPLEEELEKIKAEIVLLQSKYKYNSETEYYKVGRSEAHEEDLEIIDNHISELKGENNGNS